MSQRLKSNLQLVAADPLQHPLADLALTDTNAKDVGDVFGDSDSTDASLTSAQLRHEIDSVAVDWRSLRAIKECVCSTPFDHFSKKVGRVRKKIPVKRGIKRPSSIEFIRLKTQ